MELEGDIEGGDKKQPIYIYYLYLQYKNNNYTIHTIQTILQLASSPCVQRRRATVLSREQTLLGEERH